ncbi:hypothetical protein ACLOJK_041909 [Asimina triloba]
MARLKALSSLSSSPEVLLKETMESIYSHVSRQASYMGLSRMLFEAMTACANLRSVGSARKIHAHLISIGLDSSIFLQNHLLNMYSNCGLIDDARQVFYGIKNPNVFSWNTFITGCANSGLLDEARKLFDEMPERDSVSWNVMMTAYTRAGQCEKAIKVFVSMIRGANCVPDPFTLGCVLKACGNLDFLDLGLQLHGLSLKLDLGRERGQFVETSILDMYVKCDAIDLASRVFKQIDNPSSFCWNSMMMALSKSFGVEHALDLFSRMPEQDIISWNTIISILSQHGYGTETLHMIVEMESQGFKPNSMAYSSALSACTCVCDLDWGKHLHARMVRFDLGSDVFAASALIDMAGLLEQAKRIIDEMPMEPSAGVWGALLAACRIHGNTRLAEDAAKHLFELDQKDSGSYVLLANLYADTGKSDDMAEVRRLMRDKRIHKNPGCSWIEVDSRIYVFSADDMTHPRIAEILWLLNEIIKKIEEKGYVNSFRSRSQSHHSEKLAVAFGLISLPSWAPIHVMKNLRRGDPPPHEQSIHLSTCLCPDLPTSFKSKHREVSFFLSQATNRSCSALVLSFSSPSALFFLHLSHL